MWGTHGMVQVEEARSCTSCAVSGLEMLIMPEFVKYAELSLLNPLRSLVIGSDEAWNN
jgi:hypothetical protein